jgi:Flp pilus assembly pilin Flp
MNALRQTLFALLIDDHGDTLVEYSLILGVLSLIAITAMSVFGANATAQMNSAAQNQLYYEQNPP